MQSCILTPPPTGCPIECAAVAMPGNSSACIVQPQTLTLTDPTSPESMGALAAQLLVLETLFNSLMQDALSARYTPAKVSLVRAALQAQSNYTRTVTKLVELKKLQNRSAVLTLEAEGWD
jgi:hypothetical protein